MKFKTPCDLGIDDLEKSGSCFHCKSCVQKVYDFRGLSSDEVEARVKPGMCIIASTEEVIEANSFSINTLRYSLITLFCAFSLVNNGLMAQHSHDDSTKTESTSKEKPNKQNPDKQVKKFIRKQRKAMKKRKKNQPYIMGCPSF
ncbi:MAG: hypothetical protein AB8B53_06075 [Flavobacteriales bacterium]